jgi:excisionase family DNA binding protein
MEVLNTIEARLAAIEKKLSVMKEVLTLEEVVYYTGLSKSYLYKLTSTGAIPHYKPFGKSLFFNRGEIEAWLQNNAISTNQEMEGNALGYLRLSRRSQQL